MEMNNEVSKLRRINPLIIDLIKLNHTWSDIHILCCKFATLARRRARAESPRLRTSRGPFLSNEGSIERSESIGNRSAIVKGAPTHCIKNTRIFVSLMEFTVANVANLQH